MTIDEVKAFLEQNKETEEVKQFLSGLTAKSFEEIIKQPEVLKWRDSQVSTGINTFKDKTLPGLIEAEKKKYQESMNPQMTPEMIKIQELEKRLAEKDKSELLGNQKNKVLKILSEKGIPSDLVDYLVADTDEETDKRAQVLLDSYSKYGQKVREDVLKGHSNVVPTPSPADNIKNNVNEPPAGASKEQLKEFYRSQKAMASKQN